MPDHLGDDMRKTKKGETVEEEKNFQGKMMTNPVLWLTKVISALDEGDIAVLKRYGQGPYAEQLKQLDTDIENCLKKVGAVQFSSFH